jgi:predicted lipopolysaccharide heptosyltransferase III
MILSEQQVKKILVINLAYIGDVILSMPVTRALKCTYLNAVIDMLVVPQVELVAKGNPYVDHVIIYDKNGKHKKISELWKLIRSIRQEKYDLAICMNFAPRGAMLAWISQIKYRVGYNRQHGGWFLNFIADSSRDQVRHETENHLNILKPLEITATDTSLNFIVRDSERQSMRQKVSIGNRPIVAICPFGRSPLRSWTYEGYVELIKILSASADCFLVGAKSDKKKMEEISRGANDTAKVLAGELNLSELAAFFQEINLLITVDTGPLHIASAIGIPLVALFGPGDWRVWGPKTKFAQVVKSDADCSPCGGKPIDSCNRGCMKQISLQEVLQAIENIKKTITDKKVNLISTSKN